MADIGRTRILDINQKGWDRVAPIFYAGTALPQYGPLAQTEDDLNLIDPLDRKNVLELGCGSGHSLGYLAKVKGAGELWGLDLSHEQIRFAQAYLEKEAVQAHLLLGSMDENPGIPEAHFDLVVALYSLGWTPDLSRTLALVHAYLKPGGRFIFSGEHPVYSCLDYREEIDGYGFTRPYLKEGPEILPSWNGVEIVIYHRKLSTFLNAVAESGLVVERVVECEPDFSRAREKDDAPEKWYSVPRARLAPTTFIIKARKPGYPPDTLR